MKIVLFALFASLLFARSEPIPVPPNVADVHQYGCTLAIGREIGDKNLQWKIKAWIVVSMNGEEVVGQMDRAGDSNPDLSACTNWMKAMDKATAKNVKPPPQVQEKVPDERGDKI